MTSHSHILLVEDNADTRDSMSLLLEMEGFRVVSAANGQEGLDRLQSDGKPCLILLDLMMPILDGWGFRKKQQQQPEHADVPVVVLSADGAVEQKAASLGAAAYLQKPVEVDSLLDVVKRHC